MIRGVIIMNDQGKPRLIRFYEFQFYAVELRMSVILLKWIRFLGRAMIVNLQDVRLVYKTFATLYFVFIFDNSENELAMLDLMQVFVETLDKCFSNVCELDIVFNFNKVHTILDEIILGGQVLETSSSDVVMAVEDISK
ncbi:UNVERIFIED_CONTAM: AP-3 complex subunit sigma [Sesamum radiatum]|uniref:AP complex subunit sigma n=1 Tax=Sesamum radiatum TaxID=300843 RepID=A0AAW2S5P6_SESRA